MTEIGGYKTLILSMTDVNHWSARRLMASTAAFKKLIFMKCFGSSAGTSLFTGLNNL